jgi:hypothetical protein
MDISNEPTNASGAIPGPEQPQASEQLPTAEPQTWYDAVTLIEPHIVKLATTRGQGTGFLISIGETMCAIATAAHVIDHAHYWEEPIRVDHVSSGKITLVRHPERAIFLDAVHDTAALLMAKTDIPFPQSILPLAPKGKFLRVGNDIGWLGFPAVATARLCFFGGRVSAWDDRAKAYFVDGVAINGVSGGPAFHLATPLPIVMGVVSAYMPNRATGEVLPGMSLVRDVTQFHELAPTFASISQAKTQESPPTPPSSSPDAPTDKIDARK